MYCTNYGVRAANNHIFCRFCGLGLEIFRAETEKLLNTDSTLLEKRQESRFV
jgi:hypothetical protein